MLDNSRIVLVNTSHPGNIGSAARAMKTMGLSTLYLVTPRLFPHPTANELASGAVDILEKAIVVDCLTDAIKDCGLIVGTSTRSRTIPWPLITPRQLAEKVHTAGATTSIAILFGCEQSGLTNEELHCCHYHLQIPTHPDYSSLNVAAAVQVIAYELRMASLEDKGVLEEWDCPWATASQLENFYAHLEQVLIRRFNNRKEQPMERSAKENK